MKATRFGPGTRILLMSLVLFSIVGCSSSRLSTALDDTAPVNEHRSEQMPVGRNGEQSTLDSALDGLRSGSFRERTLVKIHLVEVGVSALPALCRALARAPRESHEARTIRGLISRIQEDLTFEELAAEMQSIDEARRLSAIRVLALKYLYGARTKSAE